MEMCCREAGYPYAGRKSIEMMKREVECERAACDTFKKD